ncbi:hypothetical protein ACFUIZ_34585 [Streptomyces cinereoruber]|uniref:hypothetical protein n=1 Tax=Streptomyces cinereoruber TaxID=67260 RepID=UPI0036290BCB
MKQGPASAIIVIGTYFGDGFGGIERVEKTTTGKPRAAAVTLLVVGDQDREVTEDAVRSPERL